MKDIPRGIEVLVKKASVDRGFKARLLEQRSRAADEIGLELEPSEAMMLDGVPAEQLETIIAHTTVAPARRAAFLGTAAAVMLAALGAGGCDEFMPVTGIAPDRPPKKEGADVKPDTKKPSAKPDTQKPSPKPETRVTKGIRPDRPKPRPEPPQGSRGHRPDRPPRAEG